MSLSQFGGMALTSTMCYQSPIISPSPPLPQFYSNPNRVSTQSQQHSKTAQKHLDRQQHRQQSDSTRSNSSSRKSSEGKTKNALSIESPSIHQILRNQGSGLHTLENFAAFLQTQFSSENLAFWLASRQYKLCALSLSQSILPTVPEFDLCQGSSKLLNTTQGRRFADLQNEMLWLIESFVRPGSPYELNLTDTVRKRLLKAVLEQGEFHPRVLAPAREAIIDLMKSTSYPLFMQLNDKQLSALSLSTLATTNSTRSRSDSGFSASSSSLSSLSVSSLDDTLESQLKHLNRLQQGHCHKPKWHTRFIAKVLKRP
ncbi:hypothetical protein BGZ94_004561 [Podila epigama]|nr:hypothetical protein BGZ94_004561 [Podila epigama]